MSDSFNISQLDTPITRATIEKMSAEQLDAFIADLQERRMRPQRVYEEAMQLKAEAQKAKDGEQLIKRLDQFAKTAVSVDNGLAKLEKYAKEILGLRLALEL